MLAYHDLPVAFLALLALLLIPCSAQCPLPNVECLANGEGSACKVLETTLEPSGRLASNGHPFGIVQARCGKCVHRPASGCGVVCETDGIDQASCAADPVTCPKTSLPAAGSKDPSSIEHACGTFGTALDHPEAVQDPRVVKAQDHSSSDNEHSDDGEDDAEYDHLPSKMKLNVTLHVRVATLNATAFAFSSRQFCYDGHCSTPGPTLKVLPGTKVHITVVNDLPQSPFLSYQSSAFHPNQLREPNMIVFGIRGLGRSMAGGGNPNILGARIKPGQSRTFSFRIALDQLPGTHWYFSQPHGSSSLHVGQGLVGAFVIDVPPHTTNQGIVKRVSSSYDAMPSNMAVFTHHSLCSCNPTNSSFSITSIPHLQIESGDVDFKTNFVRGPYSAKGGIHAATDVVLVNGQLQPQVDVHEKHWHRLECVGAVADIYLHLFVTSQSSNTVPVDPSICTMRLLAIDGVFLRGGPRNISQFLLVPGGRASIAVVCMQPGTFYLQTSHVLLRTSNVMQSDAAYQQSLLQFHVLPLLDSKDGGGLGGPAPTKSTEPASISGGKALPSWSSPIDFIFPYYLSSSAINESVAAIPNVFESGLLQPQAFIPPPATKWMGVGANCDTSCAPNAAGGTPDPSCFQNPNSVNECAFIPFSAPGPSTLWRASLPSCSATEWIINGDPQPTPHPLQLSSYHFQIVSMSAQPLWMTTVMGTFFGDWRDTWPALPGQTAVRFYSDRFVGPSVASSTYLKHQDLGLAQTSWISEPSSPLCVAKSVTDNCNADVPLEAKTVDEWRNRTRMTCTNYETPNCDPNFVQTVVGKHGLFLSNTLQFTNPSFQRPPCTWQLRCPSDSIFMKGTLTFNQFENKTHQLASIQLVEEIDDDLLKRIAVDRTIKGVAFFAGPVLNISFVSSSGFARIRAQFECASTKPQYYGCPTNRMHIWKYPGRIGSDLDGAGPFPASGDNRVATCTWVVQCPPNYVIALSAIDAKDYTAEDGLHVADHSSRLLTGPISGSFASSSATFIVHSDEAIITTVPSPEASVLPPRDGFNIDYTCLPQQKVLPNLTYGCPATATPAVLNGTANGVFGTDLDGSGPIPAPADSSCSWTIACDPNTAGHESVKLSAIDGMFRLTSPVSVSLVVESTSGAGFYQQLTDVEVGAQWGPFSDTYLPLPVSVTYTSTGTVTPGVSITFECSTKPPSGETTPSIAPSWAPTTDPPTSNAPETALAPPTTEVPPTSTAPTDTVTMEPSTEVPTSVAPTPEPPTTPFPKPSTRSMTASVSLQLLPSTSAPVPTTLTPQPPTTTSDPPPSTLDPNTPVTRPPSTPSPAPATPKCPILLQSMSVFNFTDKDIEKGKSRFKYWVSLFIPTTFMPAGKFIDHVESLPEKTWMYFSFQKPDNIQDRNKGGFLEHKLQFGFSMSFIRPMATPNVVEIQGEVELDAIPGYEIEVAERGIFYLSGAAINKTCVSPYQDNEQNQPSEAEFVHAPGKAPNVLLATMEVSSTFETDVDSYTVTAGSIAVTSSVVLSGSGGKAVDQQTFALLGLMSCAGPLEEKLLGNIRLLSPAAIGDSLEGMFAGNVIIMVGVGALWSMIAYGLGYRSGNLEEAKATVYFPSVPFAVVSVLYQGTAFVAFRMVLNSSGNIGSVLAGIVGVMVAVAIPICAFWYCHLVTAQYHTYNFDAQDDQRFGKVFTRFLFPNGRWRPGTVIKSDSSIFVELQRQDRIWVTHIFWSPLIVALIASIEVTEKAHCITQYAIIGLIQFIMAAIVIIARPWRMKLDNILAAMSSITVGSGAFAIGASIGEYNGRTALEVIASLEGTISILRILVLFFVVYIEFKVEKPTPPPFLLKNIATHSTTYVFQWRPKSRQAADILPSPEASPLAVTPGPHHHPPGNGELDQPLLQVPSGGSGSFPYNKPQYPPPSPLSPEASLHPVPSGIPHDVSPLGGYNPNGGGSANIFTPQDQPANPVEPLGGGAPPPMSAIAPPAPSSAITINPLGGAGGDGGNNTSSNSLIYKEDSILGFLSPAGSSLHGGGQLQNNPLGGNKPPLSPTGQDKPSPPPNFFNDPSIANMSSDEDDNGGDSTTSDYDELNMMNQFNHQGADGEDDVEGTRSPSDPMRSPSPPTPPPQLPAQIPQHSSMVSISANTSADDLVDKNPIGAPASGGGSPSGGGHTPLMGPTISNLANAVTLNHVSKPQDTPQSPPKNSEDVTVWRIENGNLVEQPSEMRGQFYEGDSYVVMHTMCKRTATTTTTTTEVETTTTHSIYCWIGSLSTPDEIRPALEKANDLDESVGGRCNIRRELQGHEDPSFLALFKPQGLRILSGGIDSHSYTVRLFHVSGTSMKNTKVRQVRATVETLNEEDVFLADLGEKIYIFQGVSCSPGERNAARTEAEKMADDRGTCPIEVVTSSDAPADFWVGLGGKAPVAEAPPSARLDIDTAQKRLLRVHGSVGHLSFEKIASGAALDPSRCASDGTYVFDLVDEVIVWIGKRVPGFASEKSKGLAKGAEYAKKHCEVGVPLLRVIQGEEGDHFNELFFL